MMNALVFAAVLVGLCRPQLVRNKKALVLAIVFLVLMVVGGEACQLWRLYQQLHRGLEPEGDWVEKAYLALLVGTVLIAIQAASVISVIVAYWPVGQLVETKADQPADPTT